MLPIFRTLDKYIPNIQTIEEMIDTSTAKKGLLLLKNMTIPAIHKTIKQTASQQEYLSLPLDNPHKGNDRVK